MIRINLLGEKVDSSSTHFLQLSAAVCCLIAVLGTCFFVQGSLKSELAEAKREKKLVDNQLAALKKKTEKVEQLEAKKRLLKEKLVTIANLKAKKHGPVHVLDDMNQAIPDRSWLTALKETGGSLEVTGIALG